MKNLIGKRYGRLTVIENTGKKAHSRENIYLCKCDCGNTIEVRSGLLTQEKTKSCGCLYRETRKKDLSKLNQAKKYVNGIEMDLFNSRSNKNNTSGCNQCCIPACLPYIPDDHILILKQPQNTID